MNASETPLFFESGPQRPRRAEHVTLPGLDELEFRRSSDGGYDADEVDAFLDDLRVVLEAADQERTVLKADLAQARDRLAEGGTEQQTMDAVGLLSQAQLIADKCIADAETYARDLMLTARSQYREILERAEAKAAETVQDAALLAPADADREAGDEPAAVPEVEYVRTYARVAQVQLRAVLDALAEQVDQLGALPKPPRPPAAARPAGLSAAPSPAEDEDDEADDDADEITGDVRWEPRDAG
ncbi:DivIVA domain-containing protein [Luteipulveratus sp. YIM 133132]|uniref:DivIVA domain-containing protein n=1 Tax=Luteipulveratus flavus TaxID=3031728 RepID=UPI0023B00AA8|nr:DivIVA domain-containing protein [Luteipulveratus sp. YIM 133132]MDE9364826.1 DivIVA domain-containing protein [Luteipulveratus sp. YIM 133132]